MDKNLAALTRSTALFLDFDGTLVAIADRPEQVHVPEELPQLLATVAARLQGALAIVTGRALADIDQFLKPQRFAAAGLHGVEVRAAPHAPIERASGLDLSTAAAAVRQALGDENLLIENKGAALAVHYRNRPEAGPAVERALRAAVVEMPVNIIAGKFVYEARPRGIDKGSAVRAFMQSAPFSDRIPVFIGDDVTDEDGILAAQTLGGFGIKIGEGESAARYRIRDPAALAQWLTRAADALPYP